VALGRGKGFRVQQHCHRRSTTLPTSPVTRRPYSSRVTARLRPGRLGRPGHIGRR
jgi:hypothetical protein